MLELNKYNYVYIFLKVCLNGSESSFSETVDIYGFVFRVMGWNFIFYIFATYNYNSPIYKLTIGKQDIVSLLQWYHWYDTRGFNIIPIIKTSRITENVFVISKKCDLLFFGGVTIRDCIIYLSILMYICYHHAIYYPRDIANGSHIAVL